MKPKSNIWRRFRSTGEEQPIGTQPPTGTIVAFAGTTIPGGWIQVTSTQLATSYPALATLYGTSGSYVALPENMTNGGTGRVMMGGTSSIFTTGGSASYDPETGQQQPANTVAGGSGTYDFVKLTSLTSGVATQGREYGGSNRHYHEFFGDGSFGSTDNAHTHSITSPAAHRHWLYLRDIRPTATSGYRTPHNMWVNSTNLATSVDSMNITLSATTTGVSINSSGGADAAGYHSNLQPTLSLFLIVKT